MDLAAERRNGDFVRGLITSRKVTACHDVADGGVLVTVAEMALAGNIGATIRVPEDDGGDGGGGGGGGGVPAHAWLFGEDQGRYILTTGDPDGLLAAAADAGVPALPIGLTGSDGLSLLGGEAETALDTLREINESWLPAFMAGA